MSFLDYCLLFGIAALLVFAVWLYRSGRKNGSCCNGCKGDCPSCREKKKKKKSDEPHKEKR